MPETGRLLIGMVAGFKSERWPVNDRNGGRLQSGIRTSRAFLDAVRKSMRQIRTAIGSATINPDLLTAAERIQYQGYLHREDTNAAILDLAKSGVAIKKNRSSHRAQSRSRQAGATWAKIRRVPRAGELA